jgi:hypothetical protein
MDSLNKRFLLGILVSNGDCILATVLAKQIKANYPNCHLTWAISNICSAVIQNNPFVDSIWVVKLSSKKAGLSEEWKDFKKSAHEKMKAGEFDEIFLVQIYPDNVHHYDGTTRGTIYNAFPMPVTENARPILKLTDMEIHCVENFIHDNNINKYKDVILFECSSFSGQSFVNLEWATKISLLLVKEYPELAIILSTHEEIEVNHPRIIPGNRLTLRENSELTKYCSLFVGCSSGITWMAVSDAARKIPMIQFIKRGFGFSFASVCWDHEYWGLPTDHIVESSRSNICVAFEIIKSMLDKGIVETKIQFHEILKPHVFSMIKYTLKFFRKGQIRKGIMIVRQFYKRNYTNH